MVSKYEEYLLSLLLFLGLIRHRRRRDTPDQSSSLFRKYAMIFPLMFYSSLDVVVVNNISEFLLLSLE